MACGPFAVESFGYTWNTMPTLSSGRFRSPKDTVVYSIRLNEKHGDRILTVPPRCYSDFEQLRLSLSATYEDLPSMPPKSTFRKHFKPGFLENRSKGLTSLLEAALERDPEASDKAVATFLGLTQNPADFCLARRPAGKGQSQIEAVVDPVVFAAPLGEQLRSVKVVPFEARVTEEGNVVSDFKDGGEASSGIFPFTRVRFYKNGSPLMYADVLSLLASGEVEGKSLRSLYAQVLAGAGGLIPFDEYFWECRPVSEELLVCTEYEFVSIEAIETGKKEADGAAFEDKFVSHMGTLDVLQFMTPSPPPKGTNLIVPKIAPGLDVSVYRSMGSFFKRAPEKQQDALLRKLGTHMPERMKARGDPTLPLWVSTACDDIAWLHMRLDNLPKYYRFKEYKDDMPAPTVGAAPASAIALTATTPAAGQVDATIMAWNADQAYNLGADLETLASGHIQRLSQFSSVSKALEELNAGAVDCSEGMCIVFSESHASYYLLARNDQKEECTRCFQQTFNIAL